MEVDSSSSALTSSDGAINSEWSRYYDSHYQAYYWYNHSTKESKWEQQEETSFNGASTYTSKRTKQQHLEHQGPNKPNLHPRSFKEFRKEFEVNPHYFVDPSRGLDDESEQLLSNGKQKKPQKRWEVINRMICYKRCVFLHAMIVESPLAVIESFIRGIILMFADQFGYC